LDVATGKTQELVLEAPPYRLAITPDGKQAAYVDSSDIHLIDIATGQTLAVFKADRSSPEALTFSADGTRLASADSNDSSVRIWDTAGKRPPLLLRSEDHEVTSIAFSPDGRMLASGGEFAVRNGPNALRTVRTLRLWDPISGRRLRQFEGVADDGRVTALAFSPDGRLLARACMDNSVDLWDPATGQRVRRLRDKGEIEIGTSGITFSHDGRFLATGSIEGSANVWEVSTGRRLGYCPEAHEDPVTAIACSPDGTLAATGSYDCTVRIWELATGRQVRIMQGHRRPVLDVAWSSDGRSIASGSMDGSVRVWDVQTGVERRCFLPGKSTSQWALSVAFSREGGLLATGYVSGSIPDTCQLRVWDIATGKERLRTSPMPNRIAQLAFSADASSLTYRRGRSFCVFDLSTRKEVSQQAPPGQESLAHSNDELAEFAGPVASSADGRLILGHEQTQRARDSGRLWVWEPVSGQAVGTISVPGQQSHALAVSADSRFAATSHDIPGFPKGNPVQAVHLWDTATCAEIGRFDVPGSACSIRCGAFSPDATRLLTAMPDTSVLVWDITNLCRRATAPSVLDSSQLESLWADLARADAGRARRAVWALAAAPESALPFLSHRLSATPRPDSEHLRRLIADLESDKHDSREAATHELENLVKVARPELLDALRAVSSLEARRRLERVLEVPVLPVHSAEELRRAHAVEVLERIGSPDAKKLLNHMAQGAPGAKSTQDAHAALHRFPDRPASP
jgi:WD40 repeat protein